MLMDQFKFVGLRRKKLDDIADGHYHVKHTNSHQSTRQNCAQLFSSGGKIWEYLQGNSRIGIGK